MRRVAAGRQVKVLWVYNNRVFLQICLNREAINMLAQLSAWNVKQLKDAISNLLA